MTLEHRAGFKAEELETQVWNAVQGDTFTYLALAVQHLVDKHGSSPAASLLDSFQQDQREVTPRRFKIGLPSRSGDFGLVPYHTCLLQASKDQTKTGGLGACYCAYRS